MASSFWKMVKINVIQCKILNNFPFLRFFCKKTKSYPNLDPLATSPEARPSEWEDWLLHWCACATYWLLSFGVGLCRTIFCILSPGCQSISQLTTWICPQGQVITQVGNTFVSRPTKIPPRIVSFVRTTTSFIKSDLFWHFITFRIIVESWIAARPANLTDVLQVLTLTVYVWGRISTPSTTLIHQQIPNIFWRHNLF